MEHMIWGELDKHKSKLFDIYKSKFGNKLSDEEINYILGTFDSCIYEMVNLMRDGKTAHEKFYADIIMNSNDAIVGFNLESKLFLWNNGAENIFEYKKDEILGKDFAILIPQNLLEKGEKEYMIKEVERNGFIANHETERITKRGKKLFVSISRFPIYNENGEMISNVGIIRNITNEKNLEKELREKENLALIGEVVSSIAHNLSNPLNIISGNADYLLLDKKSADEGYEELKIIVDETTRITKSIRQILNFAKPLTLMLEPVNINSMIDDICSRMKRFSDKENIEIKKLFAKKLPAVNLDIELMQDVILNIINNAIHSIPSDGTINIKTSKTDKNIAIEISDNGTGISPENLPKIFKPFFTTKGYGKGTGLGLAFAERVIKTHHGSIEVDSILEEGTTFRINLPVS